MSASFSGPHSIFIPARWKRPKPESSALCDARSNTWEVRRASGKYSPIDTRGGNERADLFRRGRIPTPGALGCARCVRATMDRHFDERIESVVAEYEPGGGLGRGNQIDSAQERRADGRIEALGRQGRQRS